MLFVLAETWLYFRLNFVKIEEFMVERGYFKAVGFVLAGWTCVVKRNEFSSLKLENKDQNGSVGVFSVSLYTEEPKKA